MTHAELTYCGTWTVIDYNNPNTLPPEGKQVIGLVSYGQEGMENIERWPVTLNKNRKGNLEWDCCDCGEVVIAWTYYPPIPNGFNRTNYKEPNTEVNHNS